MLSKRKLTWVNACDSRRLWAKDQSEKYQKSGHKTHQGQGKPLADEIAYWVVTSASSHGAKRMKGSSPSQVSHDLQRLRFTATECQGGNANLLARRNFIVINLRGVIVAIVPVGTDLAKTSMQSMASMKQVRLLRCPPLGQGVCPVRAYRTPDGPKVCGPLPHGR